MKKKIIALFMVMVLAMTALAGCGDKKEEKKASESKEATVSTEDSSFFKEFSELADLEAGSETVHISYVIKSDELAMSEVEGLKDFLDADGNLALDLTFDVVTESETKFAVDLSAKVGSKIDGKLMTIALDENELYVDYAGVLDVLKLYQDNEQIANIIQQIESNLGSAIKLDVKKVSEAVSPIIENVMDSAVAADENEAMSTILNVYTAVLKDAMSNSDDVKDLAKSISDVAEKNFENLTGVDGDMYTLTINNDNMETVIEDVENLLKNDGQNIAESVISYLYKVAGENALGMSEDEIKAEISGVMEQASSAIAENKASVMEELSKAKLDTTLKINVDKEKGGNFELAMNMEAEGTSLEYTGEVEYKVGTYSISDKIPADANDVTTMITTLINMYSGYLGGGSSMYDETSDIY